MPGQILKPESPILTNYFNIFLCVRSSSANAAVAFAVATAGSSNPRDFPNKVITIAIRDAPVFDITVF